MYHSTGYGLQVWMKRLEEYQEQVRRDLFEIQRQPWERVYVQGFIGPEGPQMVDCTPFYRPPGNDVGMNPEAG